MSFFDKLGASLTNAGRIASQNVKNMSDVSQLKNEIETEKRNIQQNFSKIGKLYYDKMKDQPGEEFREMIYAVRDSEQHIADLERQIQVVRAREPELVPVPDTPSAMKASVGKPAGMVCMNCGNTYEAGNTFCAVCGQKLTAQYATPEDAAAAPVQTAEDVRKIDDAVTPPPQEKIFDAKIISPEESRFRICPNCGKKAEEVDQKFCAECGHAL